MKKKRVFITGARGFIGKNLVRFMIPKYVLYTPSHYQLELLDSDKVQKYITKNRIDYVIHAANIGGGRNDVNKNDFVYKNLKMFFNIVRNEKYVKKIIFFGSGAEYDKNSNLKEIREEDFDTKVPSDDYGFYKYICSKYILNLNSKKTVSLRLFGIYGPDENYLIRFISNSILKNLLKQTILINQNVIFDYLYIADLMKIVEHFLNKPSRYTIYNTVSGKKTDLLNIAKIINRIGSFKSKIKVMHSGSNYEYTASNTRLKRELKNIQFTSLEEGIGKLYLWYKNNLNTIDKISILNDQYIKYCKTKLIDN